MKTLYLAALLMAPLVLHAQDSAATSEDSPRSCHSSAPRAWMGLRVVKPDETVTAHLPSLPPGIGFLVKSMDPAGPAESAGLREFDLIWKLGDQMLVNEAQLAALLRLSTPGDVVTLSVFRGGKALEVKLKLAEAPLLKKPLPTDLVEAAILPSADNTVPTRVINVLEKSATFATDEGRATLSREGSQYRVTILDPKEQPIFDGSFEENSKFDSVPEDWRGRVLALRRGLDQTLESRLTPLRQPRPRVVPPAPSNP